MYSIFVNYPYAIFSYNNKITFYKMLAERPVISLRHWGWSLLTFWIKQPLSKCFNNLINTTARGNTKQQAAGTDIIAIHLIQVWETFYWKMSEFPGYAVFLFFWAVMLIHCLYISDLNVCNKTHIHRGHWMANVWLYISLKQPVKYSSSTAKREMIVIVEWHIWGCISTSLTAVS